MTSYHNSLCDAHNALLKALPRAEEALAQALRDDPEELFWGPERAREELASIEAELDELRGLIDDERVASVSR